MEIDETIKRPEEQNSVKISISGKGTWSGEIKCYSSTIDDAMMKALQKAKELEIIIMEKNNKNKGE